jgi:hypothetical protein
MHISKNIPLVCNIELVYAGNVTQQDSIQAINTSLILSPIEDPRSMFNFSMEGERATKHNAMNAIQFLFYRLGEKMG